MNVGNRFRCRVVCVGWRRKGGSGRTRSRNDGRGGGRRREGVEDEARVLFEGVTMVR